ncbi:hypothetical protein WN51_09813 [Melipona quadrifasciata]|uniref:Uncharacterized protein n=1 Tax=Melipona quadrifasciata TaxID=166423 RepID=A0A0M9A7K2_9HYME|nr:hypothetical protein WN51_09813 [Melipona quadrifasciata]
MLLILGECKRNAREAERHYSSAQTFYKDNYHPYKMSKHLQHLRETESQRRFHFIVWLVISHEDNREISNYILWTNE